MTINPSQVQFLDLKAANDAEIARVSGRIADLLAAQSNRGLSTDEQAELTLLQGILWWSKNATSDPVDPLFIAARDLFNANLQVTVPNYDQTTGQFPDTTTPVSNWAPDVMVRFAGAYGLLAADQDQPPPVQLVPSGATAIAGNIIGLAVNNADPLFPAFSRAFYAAIGEFNSLSPLPALVFPLLAGEGLVSGGNGSSQYEVKAVEFAQVLRYLFKKGINASDPQLRRKVNEALDSIQSVGSDLPPSDIGIALPDLSQTQDTSLVATNIRGLMPVYFSAMFEQLKVFQVVDKLVELFQDGILSVGLGDAGNYLYKYWKDTPNRISETERRNFYSRCFGIPGGTDTSPNREFQDLFLRFVSAASSYVRQVNIDNLLRAAYPGAVSQQQVRKSAYDLAFNCSAHGYGMTYYAATELQTLIRDVIKLLSDPDIMGIYGAKDMWQLIDQVATLELPGGAANSVRYRTMAVSGATILGWLAKNTRKLVASSYEPILNPVALLSPVPRANGRSAIDDPTDADLVNSCEQWLAVTGTEENQVEQYAQAKETPVMTSKPIQIPSVARDALEAAGVSMGLGGMRPARMARH